MKRKINMLAAFMLCTLCRSAGEASAPNQRLPAQSDPVPAAPVETSVGRRADKRFDEMLNRMQAAVEEIAQLYGNPVFLQVFTNDAERASELKQRLRAARTGDEIRREVTELEKRRDDLLSDIALREREVARLSGRLVRQRVALDALAAAVEQARKAVEDTARWQPALP